jgi:hypothetical protein
VSISVGKKNYRLRKIYQEMKDYCKIEMGTNFRYKIEFPGENTVSILIC